MMRKSEKQRTTKETDIFVSINLDGSAERDIDTGIGFFDHMMDLFFRHSGFDGTVRVRGDLEVDTHHSMEDLGIVLGQAFYEALGDKCGIRRYASFYVPMDETLVRVCLDISGRSYLHFDVNFTREKIGELETETVEEFFRAFCDNAKLTMHITELYGTNNHHICEAVFKAAAHALKEAVIVDGEGILSTKGIL